MAPVESVEPFEKEVLTFDDVIENIDWLLADADNHSLTPNRLRNIRAFLMDKRTELELQIVLG